MSSTALDLVQLCPLKLEGDKAQACSHHASLIPVPGGFQMGAGHVGLRAGYGQQQQ